jgi:hypothetical protein
VVVPPVVVRPWVEQDVFQAVLCNRKILGDVMSELNNHLPNNLAYYQSKRINAMNRRCFWYERTFPVDPHSFNLRHFRFVVRDSDPSMLEVIWVVVAA